MDIYAFNSALSHYYDARDHTTSHDRIARTYLSCRRTFLILPIVLLQYW